MLAVTYALTEVTYWSSCNVKVHFLQ